MMARRAPHGVIDAHRRRHIDTRQAKTELRSGGWLDADAHGLLAF